MGLDVLLQILRPLESLATEFTLVRLQGDVDANVRGDMVALDSRGVASAPLASQVQVVGALATDMTLADVLLQRETMLITDALVAHYRPAKQGVRELTYSASAEGHFSVQPTHWHGSCSPAPFSELLTAAVAAAAVAVTEADAVAAT